MYDNERSKKYMIYNYTIMKPVYNSLFSQSFLQEIKKRASDFVIQMPSSSFVQIVIFQELVSIKKLYQDLKSPASDNNLHYIGMLISYNKWTSFLARSAYKGCNSNPVLSGSLF